MRFLLAASHFPSKIPAICNLDAERPARYNLIANTGRGPDMGILEDFANGNINPNERGFKRNTEYGRAVKAVSDSEDKLLVTLNEGEKKLYEDYFKAQMDLESLSLTGRFIEGYRLGALMMLEVLTGAKVTYIEHEL